MWLYIYVCVRAQVRISGTIHRNLTALAASGMRGGGYFSQFMFCTFRILYHIHVLSIQKIKFLNFHFVYIF